MLVREGHAVTVSQRIGWIKRDLLGLERSWDKIPIAVIEGIIKR